MLLQRLFRNEKNLSRSNALGRPRSAVSRYKHRKNNDPRKRREAVLYLRVSTPDQQREGHSIPAHVKVLEDSVDDGYAHFVAHLPHSQQPAEAEGLLPTWDTKLAP